MDLDTSIEQLDHVGKTYKKRLKKLGIKDVRDLLFHFPHRYEDFSNIIPISKVKRDREACIQGKILEIESRRAHRKKMILTEAIVEDESGAIKVVWFNQPYLTKTLKSGQKVCLAGKVKLDNNNQLSLTNPAYERIKGNEDLRSNLTHTGRIVPVYPETEGLSSRWLRFILKPTLAKLKGQIPEILPTEVLKQNDFLPINEALKQIHFPDSKKKAKKARERFSFEEIFLIELLVLRERQKLNQKKAHKIEIKTDRIKNFVDSLSFELTDAQKKSSWQILKDLEKEQPMNRLLEGDVGSGKTVVAAIAAFNTIKDNLQVAIMAPTEVLAKQHFKEFSDLFKDFKINIGILTGKTDRWHSKKLKHEDLEISREKLLEKTEKGEIDVLIGTHALITNPKKESKRVRFNNLGLVILDEQHRFGVEQRAKLTKKEKDQRIPHFLSMTATPIPRTLALTIYGDLDLSLIDELPPGRKKVKTKVIDSSKRERTYNFIKKEIEKGRQAFVICPRIEVPDNKNKAQGWADVKAVEEEHKKLSEEVFPDFKVGKLHGKMSSKQKERIMTKFKNKKIDILVSTSVVEVGIDVPNASVMMIEGAERFGLAQLHQFRGRVGRSEYESYCFLFTESSAKKTRQRLRALVTSENSFELAEKDLKIRGPGNLAGTRQWGIPDLAMSALSDINTVEKARESAKDLLEKDPRLKKHLSLKRRLKDFNQRVHLE